MARDATVSLSPETWTELTNADVLSITFQNKGPSGIELIATTGAAPTDFDGAKRYLPSQGELNIDVADMSPGVAAARVWAFATEGRAQVAVSHA